MKKLLIVLGCLLGIAVLILLAGGYYLSRFDPNAHKDEITKAFADATGRQLHLDGNLQLEFYPWLGLAVDQLSVDNAKGFDQTPLLAVAHAELRLKLLPLLRKHIEIGTVQLSGVRINAEVATDGSNNWTLASGTSASEDSAGSSAQGNAQIDKLSIGGIAITDTRLVYNNRQNKTRYELKNLELQINEINPGNKSFAVQKFALDFDDSHVSGTARIDDPLAMQGSFVIDIDAINADRYVPAAGNTASETATAAAKPLPLAPLRKLNLQGTVSIGQLTFSGMKLTNIKIPLQSGKGLITFNPVTASLYGGSFTGNIGLDVTGATPLVKVGNTLANIDVGALVTDFMKTNYVAGTGNMELGMEGRGNDIQSLKHNLNGTGKVQLVAGVLRGVDVGATLTTIETMIRSKQLVDLPAGGETRFNTFSATLAIQNGVVNSNDLLIKAPGWQITGMGTLADLRRDAFEFNLQATVDPTTATVANQKYDIGGHTLPITCSGSFASPRCLPDAKAILKAIAAKPARELLDKALNRLLR